MKYLTACLREKTNKAKDVTDISKNKIKLIPGLVYNKSNNDLL